MNWELSQGPGGATQGSSVSKNTQKGAKQRVAHGSDMSAGLDAKRSLSVKIYTWKICTEFNGLATH